MEVTVDEITDEDTTTAKVVAITVEAVYDRFICASHTGSGNGKATHISHRSSAWFVRW